MKSHEEQKKNRIIEEFVKYNLRPNNNEGHGFQKRFVKRKFVVWKFNCLYEVYVIKYFCYTKMYAVMIKIQ